MSSSSSATERPLEVEFDDHGTPTSGRISKTSGRSVPFLLDQPLSVRGGGPGSSQSGAVATANEDEDSGRGADLGLPSPSAASAENDGGTGVTSTVLVLMCQMAGVGVLQLPFMLRQGGYCVVLLMIFCAFMSNYTGKLLVRACYDHGYDHDRKTGRGRRVASTYAELAFLAFGPTGRVVAALFENATLVGVSCLFLILAGQFLQELFASVGLRESHELWTVCAGILVAFPSLALESIGEASFVAVVSVAATLFVVLAVIFTAVSGGPSGGEDVDPYWKASSPTSAGVDAVGLGGFFVGRLFQVLQSGTIDFLNIGRDEAAAHQEVAYVPAPAAPAPGTPHAHELRIDPHREGLPLPTAPTVTHTFLNPAGLVPAFSALTLSLGCHSGLPLVEQAMAHPKRDFDRAFNLAYSCLLLGLYLPLSIIGYTVFGNEGTHSPILCSLPKKGFVQFLAKLLVTLQIILTYPVLLTLFFTNVEPAVLGRRRGRRGAKGRGRDRDERDRERRQARRAARSSSAGSLDDPAVAQLHAVEDSAALHEVGGDADTGQEDEAVILAAQGEAKDRGRAPPRGSSEQDEPQGRGRAGAPVAARRRMLSRWRFFAKRSAFRLTTVSAIVSVAVGVPYFDIVMGLVGALCVVVVVFVLPVAISLRLESQRRRARGEPLPWRDCVPALSVLAVGSIGSGIGVWVSAVELVRKVGGTGSAGEGEPTSSSS